MHIGRSLERVRTGQCKRLMIFLPPRHGKSEFVSRYFPAACIRARAETRVIFGSYEASFAEHWGEQSRDAWVSFGDTMHLSTELKRNRGNWWMTQAGGYMTTAGVGGPITGKGMDIGIIDDPVKNAEEAYSETRREALWNWYLSTFLTRLEPGGSIVLMMTRWHHDDLAGRLLAREGDDWEVIRIPAIAEDNDPLGRKEGDALWASRFSLEQLEKMRQTLPERWWAALYQQRPLTSEGSVAKREWFPVVDSLPLGTSRKVRAWDLAATASGKADFLSGTKMERIGNQFFITDIARSRMGPADVTPRIQSISNQDGISVQLGIEQEPGASGKIVISHIAGILAGHRIEALAPSGDKVFRAMPLLDQAKAGNVFLLRGSWNTTFLDEIESFPVGKHDDQVDTAAYAFNMLAEPQYTGFSLE